MNVLVSYDPQVGATYLRLTEGKFARTVSVSDLVNVDVDAADVPLGVEFVVAPAKISPAMLEKVASRFPDLAWMRDTNPWLLTHA